MVEIPEEEYKELAECPTCGADIPADAILCPNCGQEFEEDGEDVEEFTEDSEEVAQEDEPEYEETTEDVEEGVAEVAAVETEENDFFSTDLDEEADATDEVDINELIEEGLVEDEVEEVELEGAQYDDDDGESEESEYEYEEGEEEYEYEEGDEEFEDEESVVAAVSVQALDDEPMESLDEMLVDEEKPAKMFWIGVILILVGFFGGPILSYLHDALRIPIGIFKAYEVFGWVNWLATIIGTIILGIGVLLLVIGWSKIRQWRDRMEALLADPEPTAEAID